MSERCVHHPNGCTRCFPEERPPEVSEAIAWLAADIAETMGSTIEEATEALEAALAAIPAPLDARGPVDWDSPTWGGGRHEAAWAPDGTHDDNAQDD